MKHDGNGKQAYRRTNLLNDVTFKKLFGSPEYLEITKLFLREVAKIPVSSLRIEPSEAYNIRQFADVKKENEILGTRVDLVAELDGDKTVTIELQNRDQAYFTERSMLYMSKGFMVYYNEEEVENKYASLRPIYGVNILNFMYHDESIPTPVIDYAFYNPEYKLFLVSRVTGQKIMKMITVELPKINETCKPVIQHFGALFLTGQVPEDADELLKNAADAIAFENLRKEERAMYITREDHEAVQLDEVQTARRMGRKEGREEGLKEGQEKGLKEGKEEEKREIALNFLRNGADIEFVAKGTDLSLETVKELKSTLN